MTVQAPRPAIECTVRVAGRLDDRWSARLDGFTITPGEDGTTTLAGTVADQAQLHGLLTRIGDLGIALISLDAQPQGS
jgi:hypothetical protein